MADARKVGTRLDEHLQTHGSNKDGSGTESACLGPHLHFAIIERIRMKFSTVSFLVGMALTCGLTSPKVSATVTTQGWWHYGEVTDYYADSSGNGHRFGQAFSSCVGSGQAAAVTVPFGAGGPLGPTGFTSTNALRWGSFGCTAAGMWAPGFNPPATNYGMEVWILPIDTGVLGGSSTWVFGTGSSGGVSLRVTDNQDGTSGISAVIIGSNKQIGDTVLADNTRWMHLAIVNVNGTSTFYVDGVPHGAPDVGSATVSAGDIFGGSSPGTQPTFNGYLDELRIFTFAPGQFAVSDLLLRAAGPNILAEPQSASVWEGGTAPFNIVTAIDATDTYQWLRNGTPISGATAAEFSLPTVSTADSGTAFSVNVTNLQGSVTSSNATLTVVPVKTADVNYYRAAVQAESSLLAYFPLDGASGSIVTNLSDSSHNGTLEGDAGFDGRTDRSFGVNALRLDGAGDVTISNNPAFEFTSGKGTVEALVYLDRALAPGNETIFSLGGDPTTSYYSILASGDGSSLIYTNSSLTQSVTWAVSPPLLNRFTHMAVVFNGGNVTAYIDGLSLGTKVNPGFSGVTGQPAYVGSLGMTPPGLWTGSIDEVAVYGDALSANTIAIHNSRFLFGTNVSAPTIVTQPLGTKTLFAGGSPSLKVTATGTAPLGYQWTFAGNAIPGATNATFILPATTTNSSGTYSVVVSNPIGSAPGQSFTLNFIAPPDKYAAKVMGADPLAYWRLDEKSGTNAFDVAGGNDGFYSGAVSQGAAGALPGIADTAASFVGLGDGKVSIPFSPVLNPSTPFTIEFWANPKTHTPDGATYVPMGSQLRNGSARLGWAFYMENNGTGWEFQTGDSSGVHADPVSPLPVVPGRYDHIVAVYDGSGGVQLFVNAVLEASGSGAFVPNPSNPWVIGTRNDGNFGFDGSIDEVAFYNHALTTNEITDHFSIAYVAPAVVTPPANVTNGIEAGTITITAAVAGYPNTYEWFKDGQALDSTATNPDGTPHYQNLTSTNLVITQSTPADSGKYHLIITNPLGTQTTADATIAVSPDVSSPEVMYVGADGTNNRVRVVFDRPLSATSAGTASNYKISGGVNVTGVVLPTTALVSTPTIVDLLTTGITAGKDYTLTVTGVQDTRQNQNVIGTNSTSFTALVVTNGLVELDFYGNIPGTDVGSLLSDSQYPDGVYTNLFLTNFSTSAITGGALENNPAFGSLGNNYGVHIYGWITPSASGNYRFFIRSDDSSQLNLSTNSDAANVILIAHEDGCCHAFLEPDDATLAGQTSDPIPLVANQSYFIEAFQKERGGGDFVDVAWRLEGDTTSAASLQPISGSVLSGYASVPQGGDLRFNAPTISSGQVSFTWSGTGTLQQSTDLKTWTAVAGNPPSGFTVATGAGTAKFYRLVR